MRKLIAAGSILIALAGCGTTTKSDNTLVPATPVGATADTLFKNALSDPYYGDLPKDALIPAGQMVCARLNQGDTVEDVALDFIKNNIPPNAAGQLLGAAVTVYCPRYEGMLSSAVSTYGG